MQLLVLIASLQIFLLYRVAVDLFRLSDLTVSGVGLGSLSSAKWQLCLLQVCRAQIFLSHLVAAELFGLSKQKFFVSCLLKIRHAQIFPSRLWVVGSVYRQVRGSFSCVVSFWVAALALYQKEVSASLDNLKTLVS